MKKSLRIHKEILLIGFTICLIALLFSIYIISHTQQLVTTNKAAVNTSAGFVTTQGTNFMLNGKVFKYVGFNLFDLAGTSSIYNCTQGGPWSDADLDRDLSYLKNTLGVKVIRMWGFQTYTKSGTDYSGMDRAIAFAKKYDMKLVVALEDGPGYCTDPDPSKKYSGDAKWKNLWNYTDPATGKVTQGWYNNAYNRNYKYSGYPISFPDYIDKIVPHYANEPTIMSWQVMNEAEANDVNFYEFAKTMTAQVKALAPNQLVTLGSQSSGQGGTLGADFIKVYSLPTIDYAEGHDYAYWGGDDKPLPGSSDGKTLPNANTCSDDHSISCSISQTLSRLNKPFMIGESGIIAQGKTTFEGLHWTNDQRANLLKAKMDAAFNNGVGGYILWEWNKVVDQGHDFLNPSLGTQYNDPLYPTIISYNNSFNNGIFATNIPATTSVTSNTSTPVPTTKVSTTTAVPVTVVPVAGNILTNGSFDTTGSDWKANWIFENQNGGNGDINKDTQIKTDGTASAKINIPSVTANAWDTQLRQEKIAVAAKTYKLIFSAKSSVNRNINVALQQGSGNFDTYFIKDVAITTDWKSYSFDINQNNPDSNALLAFNFGKITGQVWIDAVSLSISEITSTPIAGCLCNTNICSNSCTFSKTSNAGLSCNSEIGTPSLDDKNKYCNREYRSKGDTDGDGVVNSLDYIYYVRIVNGGTVPTNINADFNGDGFVTPSDRTIVIQNIQK